MKKKHHVQKKLNKELKRLGGDRNIPSQEFLEKVQENIWEHNFDETVAVIKDFSKRNDFSWTWGRNFRCKYVSLRIDMRDGRFVLLDSDGERISLDQLKYQYKE